MSGQGMDPISADEVLAVLPQSQAGLQLQHLSQCSLEDVERLHIQRVLEASGRNKTHTAKTLDIDYKTLLAKLKKYGL